MKRQGKKLAKCLFRCWAINRPRLTERQKRRLLSHGQTLCKSLKPSRYASRPREAVIRALLQITTNGKLKTVLAKGAAYESFPWSAFSGRNHSLGCALVL